MTKTEFTALWQSFRRGWGPMLMVHLTVLISIAAVLGPLSSGLVYGLVTLSGESALSDTAIVGFLLSPIGALAGFIIASLGLTLALLGYASLLVSAQGARNGISPSLGAMLGHMAHKLPDLLQLAARFVLRLLLVTLPFAVAIGLIYLLMLGKHDINFYLAEKPPIFLLALGFAAVIGVALIWSWIRLGSDWFHALPLVLIAGLSPKEARQESRVALTGQSKRIAQTLALWLLAPPLLTALLSLPITLLGSWLVPQLAEDLASLALLLAVLFLIGGLISFLIGFVATSLLALRHLDLFAETPHGSSLDTPLPHTTTQSSKRLSITRPAALSLGLLLIIGASALTYRWLGQLVSQDEVLVIAHRGASAAAPENTMAAFQLAIEQGSDWVEIDVQLTPAGQLLVFHDKDFKRVGQRELALRKATDLDLAETDIGSWFHPKFAGERTPRLREVLELCRGRCGVLVELKHYGDDEALEARVIEAIEEADMVREVQLMSLDQSAVQRASQLRPEWRVGLLSSVALGDLTRLDVDFLGINGSSATQALIKRAHNAGIEVYVWTINDPLQMSAMISRGVDGLITDEPGRAREVIQQRAAMNPSSRLLLELASRFGATPPAEELY